MLVLESCNVFYKDKLILSNVNLKLGSGLNLLFGPNGSGKSTLMNAIAGIPNYRIEGKAFFEELDLTKSNLEDKVKKGLILIPQHLPKNTYTKLRDFLSALASKGYKIENSYLKKFYDRILYKDFSGGEAKIIDFYIAISLKPKLLLVDEIDSGLDLNNIRAVAKMLTDFIYRGGTVLLVTHHKTILNYLPNPAKSFLIKNGTIHEI